MSTNELWAIAHDEGELATLCGAGKALGLPVNAIVFASADADGAVAGSYGAATVFVLPAAGASGLVEDYAPAIADLLREHDATLVAAGTSATGTLIAGRVAARLDAGIATAVTGIDLAGDHPAVTRSVLGGMAVKTEQILTPIAVVTIGAGAFEPAVAGAGSATVTTVDATVADSGIVLVEEKPQAGESVNLATAQRVVSVGRGFAAEEDLGLARDLAAAIGAELACSRPVAEGTGWMAREHYVGVTGVKIKPALYIAIGISGQIQHMSGVDGAKTIIAINKDKNAPVFAQSDAGLVADLYTVLPQLTEQLKGL